MEAYLFLFGIGLVWAIFAVFQDMKTTEVANWLTYSLVFIALGYRAFYSLSTGDVDFFLLGLTGFGLFWIFGQSLYYGRAFAGGDTKLLYGFGVLLPYSNYMEVLFLGLAFIFLLLMAGFIWILLYSLTIVYRNKKKFTESFKKRFYKEGHWGLIVLVFILFLYISGVREFYVLFSVLLFPLIYYYVRALDVCMIVKRKPGELIEGDWLEEDVRIAKGKWIRRSVHGISAKDMKELKKARKSVLIKDGVPFTPAFLISLIIMGYVYLVLGFSFQNLVEFFF